MNWANTGVDDTYRLWYGLSGEDHSDKWDDNQPYFHTKRDIEKISKEDSITHMLMRYTILPKFDKLAPNLTHLCLTNLKRESFSQFRRWINLKNLEVLVLSDNEFPENRLPEGVTSIKSLKKLKLTGGELHELPYSMSNLCQLESFVLSSKTLKTIEVVGTILSLRELVLTPMPALSAIPESLSNLVNLELLDLSGANNISRDKWPDIFTHMKSMRKLLLSRCELTSVPVSLSGMVNLEVLHLQGNYTSSAGMPEIFSQMVFLRELDLSRNELTSLPMSLANLIALEVFKAHDNNLERSGVPDIFGKMESLRVLDLHSCNIERLPPSIARLVKLEELDLYRAHLSSDELEFVCKSLPWLKKLDIRFNEITRLPESMSKMEQLEILSLWGNDLSSSGVPDIFSGLMSLKDLDLRDVNITTLPPSIGTLDKLTKLDVSGNKFTTLPVCLHKLTSLTELDLSGNKCLQSLAVEIVKLPNLTEIQATSMAAMRTPPSEVCAEGLSAMKKYYGL